jgi:hypothetical protein
LQLRRGPECVHALCYTVCIPENACAIAVREIGKERGGERESRSEEKYEREMKRERDFSRMTKERKPGEVKMETQRETCVEKERVA